MNIIILSTGVKVFMSIKKICDWPCDESQIEHNCDWIQLPLTSVEEEKTSLFFFYKLKYL